MEMPIFDYNKRFEPDEGIERDYHFDFDTIIDKGIGHATWRCFDKDGKLDESNISYSVAESKYLPPSSIAKALHARINNVHIGYESIYPGYYESVKWWCKTRFNWDVEQSWICHSPGVHHGIELMIKAVCNPGDNVIIQTPIYCFWGDITHEKCHILMNDLVVRNGRYEMDYEDLERKCADPKTTAIVLCSPHNPVGRVWTREELLKLAEICIRNNVFIISDENHWDVVMKPHRHIPICSLSEEIAMHSAVLTSTAKSFATAALIHSQVYIPNPEIRKKYLQAQFLSYRNVFGCAVVCGAYTKEGAAWIDQMCDYTYANYRYLRDFCAENMPEFWLTELEGTYLPWINVEVLQIPPKEIKAWLDEKVSLKIQDGHFFRGDYDDPTANAGAGFIRLNVGCPRSYVVSAAEKLKKAYDIRMAELRAK